jgi:cellulose synthase (UDP-forming)
MVRTLTDSDQAPLIQGDLSLLSGGRVTAYRVGPTYTVGALPFWLWPSWALRDQPLALLVLVGAGAVLLGSALLGTIRRRARARLGGASQ